MIPWVLLNPTFLLGLIILCLFSYQDLKFGEISNGSILGFLALGLILMSQYGHYLIIFILMAFVGLISLLLWHRRAIGGADLKILIAIVPFLSLFNCPNPYVGFIFFFAIFGIVGMIYGVMAKKIMSDRAEIPFVPAIALSYILFWIFRIYWK